MNEYDLRTALHTGYMADVPDYKTMSFPVYCYYIGVYSEKVTLSKALHDQSELMDKVLFGKKEAK